MLRLEKAGFRRLSERDVWSLAPGDKRYVTRNSSSIIAFTVPPRLTQAKPLGMSIVGCHTDSPRWLVKPVSVRERVGYSQVGVETYGGGLWATWMDRDLSCAGRVILSGTSGAAPGEYTSHLFHHKAPILRMPSVAIHLNRTQNDNYHYNPETQQVPIIAIAAAAKEFNKKIDVEFNDALDISSHHSPIFLHTVAAALSDEIGEPVSVEQIHDFEISLYDTQPAAIGGALNEFVFSSRIDNLYSSFCAVEGIIASVKDENWGADGRISLIALFDHEEVGSVSAIGAESNFMEATIERIAIAFKEENESGAAAYQRCLATSFLLSTDMVRPSLPRPAADSL